MTREEASFYLANMDRKYMEEGMSEALDMAIKALEHEPCDNVCEWFEQYVDIATDIVELRFSDGTVKKAKRGLYLRDIEKSIRKMMIDQIANEKKQESKWIPVSERLPDKDGSYLVTVKQGYVTLGIWLGIAENWTEVIAWIPLPQPYKAESEAQE